MPRNALAVPKQDRKTINERAYQRRKWRAEGKSDAWINAQLAPTPRTVTAQEGMVWELVPDRETLAAMQLIRELRGRPDAVEEGRAMLANLPRPTTHTLRIWRKPPRPLNCGGCGRCAKCRALEYSHGFTAIPHGRRRLVGGRLDVAPWSPDSKQIDRALSFNEIERLRNRRWTEPARHRAGPKPAVRVEGTVLVIAGDEPRKAVVVPVTSAQLWDRRYDPKPRMDVKQLATSRVLQQWWGREGAFSKQQLDRGAPGWEPVSDKGMGARAGGSRLGQLDPASGKMVFREEPIPRVGLLQSLDSGKPAQVKVRNGPDKLRDIWARPWLVGGAMVPIPGSEFMTEAKQVRKQDYGLIFWFPPPGKADEVEPIGSQEKEWWARRGLRWQPIGPDAAFVETMRAEQLPPKHTRPAPWTVSDRTFASWIPQETDGVAFVRTMKATRLSPMWPSKNDWGVSAG